MECCVVCVCVDVLVYVFVWMSQCIERLGAVFVDDGCFCIIFRLTYAKMYFEIR